MRKARCNRARSTDGQLSPTWSNTCASALPPSEGAESLRSMKRSLLRCAACFTSGVTMSSTSSQLAKAVATSVKGAYS